MTGEAELRSRLSALPSPPMPDDVARDLRERLAQEAAAREVPAEVIPLTATHRRRLSGLLVAAAVAGVTMLVSVSAEPGSAPVADAPPVIHAGAVYHPTGFAQRVSERFLRAPVASAPTGTFADSADGIAQCIGAVDAYGHVLSVDAGSYDEAAAVVLVTSYPANTEYEEVWVVSPQCGPSDSKVVRYMVYDVDNSTARL